jgi:competence protein ComGC
MKKSPSIITVLLVLPLLQVHSQNLEGNHTYRIGDKVEKQLVEYELNDESAKNVVWDLRDLSDLDRKHKVVYTDVYNKEQLVAGVENSVLTYYEQRESWGRF